MPNGSATNWEKMSAFASDAREIFAGDGAHRRALRSPRLGQKLQIWLETENELNTLIFAVRVRTQPDNSLFLGLGKRRAAARRSSPITE